MTLTTKAKPATAKRMEACSRILDAVGEQFEALERRAIAGNASTPTSKMTPALSSDLTAASRATSVRPQDQVYRASTIKRGSSAAEPRPRSINSTTKFVRFSSRTIRKAFDTSSIA